MRCPSRHPILLVILLTWSVTGFGGNAVDEEADPSPCLPHRSCHLHDGPFEAFEVPISYGMPAPIAVTAASVEYGCRSRIERAAEFPNAAPQTMQGGCIVMENRTSEVCACPECTRIERLWTSSYNQRDDVPAHHPGAPPFQPADEIGSELFLRIQELRAFDQTEVADCLQEAWNRYFGPERVR